MPQHTGPQRKDARVVGRQRQERAFVGVSVGKGSMNRVGLASLVNFGESQAMGVLSSCLVPGMIKVEECCLEEVCGSGLASLLIKDML